MSEDFAGRTAVVAGGGSGIGAATAELLARRGGAVVVGDLSAEAARRTAEKIEADGGSALPVAFDIADEASVGRLFDAAVERFGTVAHLVNVAADLGPDTLGVDDASDAVTLPLEVWHRTFAVDLTGHLLTIRRAVPLMLERGGGSIVNVSSEASSLGLGDKPAYSAAKAGVDALTRHVARRWGTEGIRCNAVSPGMVMTEAVRAMYGTRSYGTEADVGSRVRGINPMGRPGEPEEVASVIVHLLSDEASWVTGQLHHVSGGMVFGR